MPSITGKPRARRRSIEARCETSALIGINYLAAVLALHMGQLDASGNGIRRYRLWRWPRVVLTVTVALAVFDGQQRW
jgi:hypothetical protein